MTYARMETLRSPKQLVGPAYGMASLTFRAWHELDEVEVPVRRSRRKAS